MAVRLREHGEYFAAHYFAGIAVESILRSLSNKAGEPFDGTHDIQHWARKANLLTSGSIRQQDDLRSDLLEVNIRWRANQRYYTAKMLDTRLHKLNIYGPLNDKVSGDRTKSNGEQTLQLVKVSSERMLELANTIVSLGVQRWNKKS